MDYQQAKRVLSLDGSFSLEVLKKKYKTLVFENHPDKFFGQSPGVQAKQNDLMSEINLAYNCIREHNDKIYEHSSFDIVNDDIDFNVKFETESEEPDPGMRVHRERPKVHPHHIDQSFRKLWHKIHDIQKSRHGLALRCWEKVISQLLKDLPAYPDLDGIIHNDIRDCSSLLMRLGLFSRGFQLVRIAYDSNVESYYGFCHPSSLVWKAILNTSRIPEVIPCWEKAFFKKVVFQETEIHWAMLSSYYFANRCADAARNTEDGLIIPEVLGDTTGQPSVKSVLETEDKLSCRNAITPATGSFRKNMENDIKNILIRGLIELGSLNGRGADISTSYPRIARILNRDKVTPESMDIAMQHVVRRETSQTAFGLQIIKNPDMEYSESEVDAIWFDIFGQSMALCGKETTSRKLKMTARELKCPKARSSHMASAPITDAHKGTSMNRSGSGRRKRECS